MSILDGTSENKFANTTNLGIELEGYARLFNNVFEVTFNGTIQNPKYKTLPEEMQMGQHSIMTEML
jgi:methylphosphotriester-DNA--protein-cysteine methyltransferase